MEFNVTNLQDESGNPVNDAVITGEVQDLAGNTLITFDFANTDATGDYLGVLTADQTEDLILNQDYAVVITTTIGVNVVNTERRIHTYSWRYDV
jgi:hypothetical protein